MLIEYTIEVECEPKRRFGYEGLLDRLRRLARAMGTELPAPDEAAGARTAEFELRPQAYHCSRCPANVGRRAFGCYGAIQPPLTEAVEDWLIELLPESLKPRRGEEPITAGQGALVDELLRRMDAAGVDGKQVDRLRAGGRLLEGDRPAEQRYGGLFRRRRVTSSQLLEFLFFRGELAPADAESFLRALGIWEEGGVGEDGMPEAIFTQPVDDEDDAGIAELKQFFFALILACSLDVPVRVRLHGGPAPEPAVPAVSQAAGPEAAAGSRE